MIKINHIEINYDTQRTTQILACLQAQADSCRNDGSPLCGRLLDACADDFERGGIVAELLSDWQGHPVLDALPMRLLGAVHGLVLAGKLPDLARHYASAGGPSAGGRPDDAVGPIFTEALDAHRDAVRARLDTPVQTNEVRRCVALLGGFLEVAHATGLPLALLEIGASSGLNQIFHHYRFELGPHRYGPPEAPVCLATDWKGPAPRVGADLRVARRSGCDIAPIDLENEAARLRLESFMWGDQPERLERLRSAVAMAREAGVAIDRARAGDWLEARLGESDETGIALADEGLARVVFHSVVWWYLPEGERERVTEIIEAAGARATADAPLAWLRMEGQSLEFAELRLRLWPGGDDQLLGRTRYHGQAVEWLGTDVAIRPAAESSVANESHASSESH